MAEVSSDQGNQNELNDNEYLKEHVSSNRLQIENLQSTLNSVQSRLENIENNGLDSDNLEDEVSKLSNELEILSETITERLDELEDRIDKVDGKDRESIDELTGKEIENKIEKKIEEKSVEELNKIQKLESRIDQLEDRMNVEELEVIDEIENKPRNNAKQSKKSNKIFTPSEISKEMRDEEVKIKGELEFRKETSGNKFYKLEGEKKQIIVRSKSSIPEGRRILNGKVEIVKGNLCIFVQE